MFDRPAPSQLPPRRTATHLDGLRVLVVDDNQTNRRILEEMLISWRMEPVAIGTAAAALEALKESSSMGRPFDAVISDGQMPDVDGFMLARQIRRMQHLERTPIVMLTSADRPDDVARCRRLGIDAYLVKPVKHSDLLDALVTVFGVPTRDALAKQEGPVKKRRPRRKLRVLVAEDNAVNRKLATTLLRKRGHTVAAVDNGRAAVDALDDAKRPFDVLLLDLQMPEMSGFETAQAIRDRERASKQHLPIIAFTAHAMQGDRERCLAAGMDGYLSKPIDVDALITTVEHFGGDKGRHPQKGGMTQGHDPSVRQRKESAPPPVRTGSEPSPSPPVAADVVFDERKALGYAAGDRRLLREMVALFRADAPLYQRRIGRALDKHDGEALRTAAHGLKGAMATVGSERGRELAAALEQLGNNKRLEEAAAKYVRLRDHMKVLERAFVAAGLAPRSALKPAPVKKRRRGSRRAS
jgi:CheY-like chemotaxis protein